MPRRYKRLRVWQYPWTVERAYTASALAYVKAMQDVIIAEAEKSLPAIVSRRAMFATDAVDDDPPTPPEGIYLGASSYADRIAAMIDRIKGQIVSGQRAMGLKIKTYADQVNVFNAKQWTLMKADIDKKYGANTVEARQQTLAAERGVREAMTGADIQQVRAAMSVNVLTPESGLVEELAVWEADNIALIQSIPEQYLPQLRNRIVTAVRKGENYTSLMQEIRESFNVPEWRARLIARDQIGKLNGQLTRIRQNELGITDYLWRGMLDSRERPAHVEREGKQFSYTKPPDDGNPGEPIQCRCYPEPVIDF
jgi:SPP1 gp7 family putative phage head morphogenesis protein